LKVREGQKERGMDCHYKKAQRRVGSISKRVRVAGKVGGFKKGVSEGFGSRMFHIEYLCGGSPAMGERD